MQARWVNHQSLIITISVVQPFKPYYYNTKVWFGFALEEIISTPLGAILSSLECIVSVVGDGQSSGRLKGC